MEESERGGLGWAKGEGGLMQLVGLVGGGGGGGGGIHARAHSERRETERRV